MTWESDGRGWCSPRSGVDFLPHRVLGSTSPLSHGCSPWNRRLKASVPGCRGVWLGHPSPCLCHRAHYRKRLQAQSDKNGHGSWLCLRVSSLGRTGTVRQDSGKATCRGTRGLGLRPHARGVQGLLGPAGDRAAPGRQPRAPPWLEGAEECLQNTFKAERWALALFGARPKCVTSVNPFFSAKNLKEFPVCHPHSQMGKRAPDSRAEEHQS